MTTSHQSILCNMVELTIALEIGISFHSLHSVHCLFTLEWFFFFFRYFIRLPQRNRTNPFLKETYDYTLAFLYSLYRCSCPILALLRLALNLCLVQSRKLGCYPVSDWAYCLLFSPSIWKPSQTSCHALSNLKTVVKPHRCVQLLFGFTSLPSG